MGARWRIRQLAPANLPQLHILFCRPRVATRKHLTISDELDCLHFFYAHVDLPCWAQDLARGLNSSRSSWLHGCGRMGQTSRCFMVCSSPHSHVVCSSSLNPHFCIMDLHRPVPVRRRFRLDQVGHASLETWSQ